MNIDLLFSKDRAKVCSRQSIRGRRFFLWAAVFAIAVLVIGGAAPSALGATSPAASTSSINGKSVNLNGAPMAAGATLFPGDVIRLGENSTAALQFGKSLVLAAPETELVVEPEGVSLRDGRVQVRAGSAQPFAIAGPFFHVDLAAAGGAPSTAEIRFGKMRAQITAVSGFADVTSEGYDSPYRLRAGETATLDASAQGAAPPQGANQDAGEIIRLTPPVQIDRDLQHMVAAVSQRVLWYDDLRSGPTVRAHVTLNDGTQLSLGSDSSLLVLQHDAQAQQTSLDLVTGRVRGQVMKLTKPAGKFEVRTPVGTAALVGTDFSLNVTPDYVDLMVFDGAVRFTTADGRTVTVNTGMKVRIPKQGPFEGPSAATPEEQLAAKSLTDTTDIPPAGQTTVATAKRHLVPIILTISGAAAAGLGVGIYELTRPKVSGSAP
jgi:ferric-dicitrate binding protein FerR (iron transport regulator)